MEASVVICDFAQVHAGKLYIVGSAINLAGTPAAEPPHPINLFAAALVRVPWQAHNQVHRLNISLRDDDGGKVPLPTLPAPGLELREGEEGTVVGQFNAGRGPIMQAGDDSLLPIAVPLQVAVPRLDRYHVKLEIDGTELASATFRVLHGPSLGMG